MSRFTHYLICIVFGVTLGLSITLAGQEQASNKQTELDFYLLRDVMSTIGSYYVDPISKSDLIQAAINGMFDRLDSNSYFLNDNEMQQMQDTHKGEYFGFGFEISSENNHLEIITPFPDSPADKAGILPGDSIVRLNKSRVTKDNLEQILERIKQHSRDSESINLEISRPNQPDAFKVNLTPEVVAIHSVTGQILEENIGYIRLNNFQENSTRDIMSLVESWQQLKLNGLIIDLRNNPGGLLDQAVNIADLFLTKGLIVSTQGRFYNANASYQATDPILLPTLPILVLINKGSASASEVLAAALQENGRAKLLGETSFGKGTVQSLIPARRTGHGIKLTIAQYRTPNGNNIHKKGVTPDILFATAKTQTEEEEEEETKTNEEVVAQEETAPQTKVRAKFHSDISPHREVLQDRVIIKALSWMKTAQKQSAENPVRTKSPQHLVQDHHILSLDEPTTDNKP